MRLKSNISEAKKIRDRMVKYCTSSDRRIDYGVSFDDKHEKEEPACCCNKNNDWNDEKSCHCNKNETSNCRNEKQTCGLCRCFRRW